MSFNTYTNSINPFESYLNTYALFGLKGPGLFVEEERREGISIKPFWQIMIRELLLPYHIETFGLIPDNINQIFIDPYEIFGHIKGLGEFQIMLQKLPKERMHLYNPYKLALLEPWNLAKEIKSIVISTYVDGENFISSIKTTPEIDDMLSIAILSIRAIIYG